jgi:hypothetical protein
MSGLVEFTLNGIRHSLDAATVRTALRGGAPDVMRQHWVEVDGVRWPPRQAFALSTGLPRDEFVSDFALRQLRRLGFATSDWETSASRSSSSALLSPTPESAVSVRPTAGPQGSDGSVAAQAAFATLLDFLDTGLTDRIRSTEEALEGADRDEARGIVTSSGMTAELLEAVLLVRQLAGRLNDVVHAATIVQLLPDLLEPGEEVHVRPSLAAGNDPGRPFDLETNLRVAEFKLSFWKGADAMRKRGVFADLVHLAMDDSARRAQLFVVGQAPINFLRSGQASAAWALGRSSPNLRARFAERYGSDEISIRKFTHGPAGHVELIDLMTLMPVLGRETVG